MNGILSFYTQKIFRQAFFILLILILNISLGFSQKNNLKVTTLTDLRYSVEYERVLSSNWSITIGYMKNNTHYRSRISRIIWGGTGENLGRRFLLSVRYSIRLISSKKGLSHKSARVNSKSLLKKQKREGQTKLYLASIFLTGRHKYQHYQKVNDQFVYINLPNGGRAPSRIDARLRAYGAGLNIGLNTIGRYFNFDYGFNITYNTVIGYEKGLRYADGTLQKFPTDLKGLRPGIYFGIGYTF